MERKTALRIVLGVALLTLAIAPPAAFAGRGGGGQGKPGGGGSTGGGTIALAPLVYDANGNGLPNYGDTVTFDISTGATQPYVNLYCYQNGVLVAQGSNGFFDGALNLSRNFGLYSGKWTGGAADCTAYLDTYTRQGWSHLASTSFHVDA
jgi:hypothetical protein